MTVVVRAIGPEAPVPVSSTTSVQETTATATTSPTPLPEPVLLGADSTARRVTRVGLDREGSPLDIPDAAHSAYGRAATVMNAADAGCRLDWSLVAAIGFVESNHGRHSGSRLDEDGLARPAIRGRRLDGTRQTARIEDTDAGLIDGDQRFDRAVGPMQILPSTWAQIGVDADGDDVRDSQDVDDAALAAAVYLCSGSEDLSTEAGRRASVHRYNPDDAYVALVLDVAKNYAAGDFWTSAGKNLDVVSTPTLDPSSTPAAAARDRSPDGGIPEGTLTTGPVRPSDDGSPSPPTTPSTTIPSTTIPPTTTPPTTASPSGSATPSASTTAAPS